MCNDDFFEFNDIQRVLDVTYPFGIVLTGDCGGITAVNHGASIASSYLLRHFIVRV